MFFVAPPPHLLQICVFEQVGIDNWLDISGGRYLKSSTESLDVLYVHVHIDIRTTLRIERRNNKAFVTTMTTKAVGGSKRRRLTGGDTIP